MGRRDSRAWVEVRRANEQWLRPWEASLVGSDNVDWRERHSSVTYRQVLARQRAGVRDGTQLPFGIYVGEQFAGQVTVGEIVRGALCSGSVGYWIDNRFAGRGVTPVALALVADHAFASAGLHRIEANVRPENVASLAVVEKVGFTNEGRRRRYLAIDGAWRDHLSFSLLADDIPGGVLTQLIGRYPQLTAGIAEEAAATARKG
jgi:ribosomal-protein-alanine N-acetyltransferase